LILIRSQDLKAKARSPTPTVWWCDGDETLERIRYHILNSIAECEMKCIEEVTGCYAFDIRGQYCELFTKKCAPDGPPVLLYVRPSAPTSSDKTKAEICRNRSVEL
jgi:hypothetical protein